MMQILFFFFKMLKRYNAINSAKASIFEIGHNFKNLKPKRLKKLYNQKKKANQKYKSIV